MLPELLQDRAALYVAGALDADQRDAFELVLDFQPELRVLVARLQEVGAAVMLSSLRHDSTPPPNLRARILSAVASRPRSETHPMVVTCPRGRVEWVNPQFTAMCGHSFEEIRGRKPGEFLQGPDTDAEVVKRIRDAIRERRKCREKLVNYHRDGTRYEVELALTPVLDDAGEPLWFVAQERKLANVA
jgi:PAS domain S-box-containing protein